MRKMQNKILNLCILLIVLIFSSCAYDNKIETELTSFDTSVCNTNSSDTEFAAIQETTISNTSITTTNTSQTTTNFVTSIVSQKETTVTPVIEEYPDLTVLTHEQETKLQETANSEISTVYQEKATSDTSITTTSTSQTTTNFVTSMVSQKETTVTSVIEEYPDLTPLTYEQETKLKDDFVLYKSKIWPDAKSEEMFIMDYYGIYNDCEVVIMWGYGYDCTADIKKVDVGDWSFLLTSGSYEILLHKGSEFIDIKTAYSEGYLSDEDIKAIYFYANN